MNSQKSWLLASLAILTLVIVAILLLEDTAEIDQVGASHYRPPVSVVEPQPQNNSGVIQAYGEVRPRWSATLKAQVSGEIVEVTHKALAGESVNKGELLIRIEASRYQADLHEAERALAEAELNLIQEQIQSEQARENLHRSGMNIIPSDLALRKPQLALAKRMPVPCSGSESTCAKNCWRSRRSQSLMSGAKRDQRSA